MKKKVKNLQNGYITVRIGNNSIYDYAELTKENVHKKLMDHAVMLGKRGIEYAYIVGYPTDSTPILAVHKKFGKDWEEQGLFPELFEEVA